MTQCSLPTALCCRYVLTACSLCEPALTFLAILSKTIFLWSYQQHNLWTCLDFPSSSAVCAFWAWFALFHTTARPYTAKRSFVLQLQHTKLCTTQTCVTGLPKAVHTCQYHAVRAWYWLLHAPKWVCCANVLLKDSAVAWQQQCCLMLFEESPTGSCTMCCMTQWCVTSMYCYRQQPHGKVMLTRMYICRMLQQWQGSSWRTRTQSSSTSLHCRSSEEWISAWYQPVYSSSSHKCYMVCTHCHRLPQPWD